MKAEGRPLIEVALAVVGRGDRFLVARRGERVHLGRLWEFPGGKIRAGEQPTAAARRELYEETGLRGGELEPLLVFVHDYGDRAIRFHCFVVRDAEGTPAPRGGRDWRWAAPDELAALEMPAANVSIVRSLIRRSGRTDGDR